jgi:hypothetical protein
MIVIVFDPLAVIMLLASQMTFGWKEDKELNKDTPDPYVADVGEKPTVEEIDHAAMERMTDEDAPPLEEVSELEQWNSMIAEAEKAVAQPVSTVEERVAKGETYIDGSGQEVVLDDAPKQAPQLLSDIASPQMLMNSQIMEAQEESKKKTYMIKDELGQIQTKTKE